MEEIYNCQIKNLKSKRLEKLKDFLALDLLGPNIVLAGGSLRTIFDKYDEIKDFDIFFLGSSSEVEKNKDLLVKRLAKLGASTIYMSSELHTFEYRQYQIQLISMQEYLSIEELIDSFDLNISKMALHEGTLYFEKEAILGIKKKELGLNSVTHPYHTLNRIYRFKEKGYQAKLAIKSLFSLITKDPSLIEDDEYFYKPQSELSCDGCDVPVELPDCPF